MGQNENDLAELVLHLRSLLEPLALTDLRTTPLGYGSAGTGSFLAKQNPYTLVLNFAALEVLHQAKKSGKSDFQY